MFPRLVSPKERERRGRGIRSAGGRLFVFQVQKGFLAFSSPAIASHVTIGADYAVAGNCDRDRIRGAGASNSASGGRLSDSLCYLAVGTGCAEGDGLQVGPHPALECRGLNVEWKG